MNEPVEVLITIPFPDSLIAQLQAISPRLKITLRRVKKADEIPNELWAKTEVLYTSSVLPTPQQAPDLHWIQFHWAGVDHVLDAPILNKPGLLATTLSGAAASQVAEYILMMFLALGHRLPDLMANQKKAEWPKDRWERFSPVELRGSTVGIVGYGSIGRQVARLLQHFGAIVLATKRDVMHPEDTDYTPENMGDPNGDFVHRLYPAQALRSMLKDCDFVAVTVPKTPETLGLIKADDLAVMKPEAFLVDISRGGIIDQAALIASLRERRIAGAALDVFPEEPLSPDNPLWKMPNVIITPHISGITAYYDERAIALFSENLQRYLANLPLYNRFKQKENY